MDPVGTTTSILAILSATTTLLGYVRDIKNARKDLQELQKELSTLCSLFYMLSNLQSSHRHSTTVASTLHVLGTKDGPLDQYRRVLEDLSGKFQKRNAVVSSMSFVFNKAEVKEMLEKIERLKSTISMNLNISQIVAADDMKSHMDDVENQSRLQEALQWLSTVDCRGQHEFLRSYLKMGTGEWFISSPEFQGWLQHPKGQVLFCPGIPGAGKTMMAARAVDHIQSKKLTLAYLYCDYNYDKLRSVSALLGEILRQLVENNEKELAPSLLTFFDDHMERKTRPSDFEIYNLLKSVLSRNRTVYFIIDAVDEIPQTQQRRRVFLDILLRLQSETNSAKLMITSRFLPDVLGKFSQYPTLEIKANPADISLYVDSQFDTFKASTDEELQRMVSECIAKTANGMFLLAHLLLQRFANLHTRKMIKALVSSLSAQNSGFQKEPLEIYSDIYRDTMKRIEDQGDEDAELARKAIRWITHTARALSMDELCCALSVELDSEEFDMDNWYSVDLITSVCAGLVMADKSRNVIRLVHHTAHEYFEGVLKNKEKEINLELCSTCLTYLCYREFKPNDPPKSKEVEDDSTQPFELAPSWAVHYKYCNPGSQTGGCTCPPGATVNTSEVQSVRLGQGGDSPDSLDRNHCLLDYAANFWAFHAKSCEKAVSKRALRLLGDQQLAAHAFRSATSLYSAWPYLCFTKAAGPIDTKVTGLHLVAALGLPRLCSDLLAVIDKIAKLNAGVTDDGRRTPLMWATHHGQEDIVKLLLARRDAGVWKRCSRGDSALNFAARAGWAPIVEQLLHKTNEADIRHENCFGETAFVQAALEGHEDVVNILKPWDGSSINREVMFGMWPVHLAAQMRPASTFRFLVEKCGMDITVKDPKNYTPFMVAVDWGNEEVVRYFLEERKTHQGDANGQEVFQAAKIAAETPRRFNILQLIVEADESVLTYSAQNGRKGEATTLLEAAVDAANSEAVIYLSSRLLGKTTS